MDETGRFIVMVRSDKNSQWELAYICLSEQKAWAMAAGIEQQAKNLKQKDECTVLPEGSFDRGSQNGKFQTLKRPSKLELKYEEPIKEAPAPVKQQAPAVQLAQPPKTIMD
jgi:hypothetical protein